MLMMQPSLCKMVLIALMLCVLPPTSFMVSSQIPSLLSFACEFSDSLPIDEFSLGSLSVEFLFGVAGVLAVLTTACMSGGDLADSFGGECVMGITFCILTGLGELILFWTFLGVGPDGLMHPVKHTTILLLVYSFPAG